MSRRAALLLIALAIAGVGLVTSRPRASHPPAAADRAGAAPLPDAHPAEPAVDPEAIRDVFRFAEPRAVAPAPAPRPTLPAMTAPSPEAIRLVGLVRRQGRLLAAFAVEGDVVLAGPGESAGGVTVLEVDEEGVRVRHPDGAEARLSLP